MLVAGSNYNVGDIDRDNRLDANETWSYTASGTATAGAYLNVARVTARGQTGAQFTDNDPARYFGTGVPPSAIRIEKAINAVDPTRPTGAEDADAAPGPNLQVGTAITWTYQVFNDGNAPIRVTALVDDFGTPGNAADDFAPAAVSVTVGNTVYNVGDTDRDNLLDPGEAWRYTSAGTAAGNYQAAAGQYTNLAKVTGVVVATGTTVQDDDPANYFGGQITSPVVGAPGEGRQRGRPRAARRPTRTPTSSPGPSSRWAARWSGPTRRSTRATCPWRSRRCATMRALLPTRRTTSRRPQ